MEYLLIGIVGLVLLHLFWPREREPDDLYPSNVFLSDTRRAQLYERNRDAWRLCRKVRKGKRLTSEELARFKEYVATCIIRRCTIPGENYDTAEVTKQAREGRY